VPVQESKEVLNEGRAAVHNLRRALAGVLSAVGADAGEPQETSRRFRLDKTLAWRIASAVREEDPWEALQHIPGRPGIGIFVTAMSSHGAPADRIESVWEALAQFEKFIATHTRDRETFEMMVSTGGGGGRKSAEKRLEASRKAGSQANSALLGVRATAHFCAHFVAPSDTTGMVDLAMVSSLVGFCRLRSNVPWAIATLRGWKGPQSEADASSYDLIPIDERIAKGEPPILREFCTQPVPEIRVSEHPPGTFRFMLAEGPVGYSAAATVVTGWLYKATAPIAEGYPGEKAEYGANLCTPADALVFDLFVHRELPVELDVRARVYSLFPGGPQYPDPGSEATLLPVPIEVIDKGYGAPDSPTQEFARYRELAQRVGARMGKSLDDFHLFRYRLPYPPIPALAVLSHPLQRR
jgi:hypothetical protein